MYAINSNLITIVPSAIVRFPKILSTEYPNVRSESPLTPNPLHPPSTLEDYICSNNFTTTRVHPMHTQTHTHVLYTVLLCLHGVLCVFQARLKYYYYISFRRLSDVFTFIIIIILFSSGWLCGNPVKAIAYQKRKREIRGRLPTV